MESAQDVDLTTSALVQRLRVLLASKPLQEQREIINNLILHLETQSKNARGEATSCSCDDCVSGTTKQ